MHRTRWRLVALLSALILFAASCSSGGSSEDRGAAEAETTPTTEDEAVDSSEGEDGEGEDAVTSEPEEDEVEVEPVDIDATVQWGGIVYDIADLEVDDQRADNVALPVVLTFNVQVENLLPDTATPGASITLRWDQDGDVYQTSGRADFRDVPSGSTSRGTIEVTLTTADLETWDQDTARLVLGQENSAQAEVPLDGSDPVDRLSITQDQSIEFDLEGLTFESDEIWVSWHLPNSGTQADDGSVWLVLRGPMENDSGGQQCIRRGAVEGSIELLDGTARVFEGSTLNCISGGDIERDVLIIFEIDDPFAGTYPITFDGIGDGAVTVTVTLSDDAAPDEDDDEDAGDDEEDEDDEDEDDE